MKEYLYVRLKLKEIAYGTGNFRNFQISGYFKAVYVVSLKFDKFVLTNFEYKMLARETGVWRW